MRARNIKPGFYKNEQLAECHPLARILFSGLWCCADREGRLEDRPKRIKAEILPYDNCDCEKLLTELQKFDFIQRYEIEKNKYIQIVNFAKHQNPHCRESESTIPAPTKAMPSPEKAMPSPADSLIPEKKCIKCGNVLLVKDFPKSKICKDGHTNECKQCRNKRRRKTPSSKKINNEETIMESTILLIDLKGQPELFERLKKPAQDELRTPEMQALYIIREKLMD